jgi:protein-S-isoprenylcysteine O-methyltransferase Ste14
VTTETKFVYILAGFCVLLLVVGTVIAKKLSTAPPRVIRAVWPVVAALTGVCFATLVYIARLNVKG